MSNTNSLAAPQGEISIFACGGFGVNIGSFYESNVRNPEPGHARPKIAYLDTSHANFNKVTVDPASTYVIPEADGSGGKRVTNYEEIARQCKPVLQKFEPSAFNVVIFSANGGSGSVIGPVIMGELMRRGLPVVGIVVGGDASNLATENTINTLKSLEGQVKASGMPAVIFYDYNRGDVKRSELDADFRRVISSLAVLASRQNDELDSKDIEHWLQFHKVTGQDPQVAVLDVFASREDIREEDQQAISIASLYSDPDMTQIDLTPEYSTVGYLRHDINEKLKMIKELHFIITPNATESIMKKLRDRKSTLDEKSRSRTKARSLLDSSDTVNEGGMVL